MSLDCRLKLHVIVYQIVSLRIEYGNYEDSETVRNKLAAQTLRSIAKRKEVENTDELEQAQKLLDLYSETAKGRPTLHPMTSTKPPERITQSV
jgi:hypothetical protein